MSKVKLEKGRAPLLTSMVERFGPPDQSGPISVWLFLVVPGHFRVFSADDIAKLIDVDELNRTDAVALETQEERERVVGLRMRLISTTIIPVRRLKIPSEAFDVCNEYLDRAHVWLEQSSSYVDLYTTTYVQRLLAISPAELLPSKVPDK